MSTTKWLHKYSVPLLLLVAAALTAGSYFLPVAPGTVNETATHWRMVSTVAMVTLIASGAVLFLQGVSAFKSELQRAYRWFSVGMILFAVALLQWPFLVLMGEQEGFWVRSGLVIIPFVLSSALMYKGMQQFAKLLKIQSHLTSWPITFTLVMGGAALSAVVAYVFLSTIGPSGVPDDMYMYTGTVGWCLGFLVLAWMLSRKVQSAIGTSYHEPMKWLVIALGAVTLSAFHELVTSVFVGEFDWYLYSGAISWPFIVSGLLFVVAGHKFDAERIRVAAIPGQSSAAGGADVDRAYIDSITSIAQLASQPRDVDPILDGLRRVTANSRPNTPLSEAERQELLNVYHQLEEYLLQADPLKTFTVDQLRPMLAPEFRAKVEGSTLRAA